VGIDDEGLDDFLVRHPGDKGPSFETFGGYHAVRERAIELIETQLNKRGNLDAIRARPVKGIIFTGPPGTGKTYLARIIANESKASFYLVSGPSIVSKWLGDSEETLRRIFEAAAKEERAIIFFDEIDSIAERRTENSHEASKRLVAQLLTLLDGFDQGSGNVVVIAATNRIEDVDGALLRPGRFDWEISFGMPTLDDRFEILQVGARHLETTGDLPFEEVALLTDGWSAARLSSIWTEAALVAASDDRRSISDEDMALALERVSGRPTRLGKEGEHSGN
jgi:transitional endoplasmic reticulum ATPase